VNLPSIWGWSIAVKHTVAPSLPKKVKCPILRKRVRTVEGGLARARPWLLIPT
jgi:hypothetical protein